MYFKIGFQVRVEPPSLVYKGNHRIYIPKLQKIYNFYESFFQMAIIKQYTYTSIIMIILTLYIFTAMSRIHIYVHNISLRFRLFYSIIITMFYSSPLISCVFYNYMTNHMCIHGISRQSGSFIQSQWVAFLFLHPQVRPLKACTKMNCALQQSLFSQKLGKEI